MEETIICYSCNTTNNSIHAHCSGCGKKLMKKKDRTKFQNIVSFFGSMLKQLIRGILNNFYLILISISLAYFAVYMWVSYLSSASNPLSDYELYWYGFWKDISLLIFTAGIFTASLKYLQYIRVFEKEFDRILGSDKYNEKLKQSIESITLSEDYFLKQNNLEHIWEIVTLSKYRKGFPDIYDILKKNIKNELFEKNNISYYYKHFKIEYKISKVSEDGIVIKEVTNYTIVRHTNEPFDWDFEIRVEEADSGENNEYPSIEFEVLNNDGIVFAPEKDIEIIQKEDQIIKLINKELKGNDEYHIKRTVIFNQNLKNDRQCVFGCDRIIDDLEVVVKYDKDLKVLFSPAWKVKFYEEEIKDLGNVIEMSYFNRDLILPGEKYKLFILKV